jgi:hypothetical protein
VEEDAGDGRNGDDRRLGDLDPALQEQGECDEADQNGEPARDRLAADHDRRGGGRALDEALQAWMPLVTTEETSGDDDER